MDSVVISIQPYMVRVFGSVEYTTYHLEDKESFDCFMKLLKRVDGCNDDDYCLILFDELLEREKSIRYTVTDGAPIDREECPVLMG